MRELERDIPSRATEEKAHPPITVIGPGRLGGSIAATAATAGFEVTTAGREDLDSACAEAEIVLLSVPDAEISRAASRVGELAPGLRFLGHCSGATGLDALDGGRRAGVEAFSLHPLQTIPDRQTTLAGAPAAIAGSGDEALAVAERLARALGMTPFEVPEPARAAYHAAASIASNFLVALEQSAVGLLDAAGIEGGGELLAPLVLRTAANWSEHGDRALTGPIARGDEATVGRHLAALRESAPELVPLYEALAERTRALAASGEPG